MTAIETHTGAGTRVEFRVLGPLEAYCSEASCDLGGPKQRTVLAALLARAGRRVSTGDLVDTVYGDDAPNGARRSVQTYVSNLRSALGDVIVGTRNGYIAKIERDDLDATRFEDAVTAAHDIAEQDPRAAADLLVEALALWRGHPYADVDGGPAIAAEIARLEELRLVALETRIDADLALGHHELLIPELDGLTAEYAYRERLRAQHMLALYRSGRQTEALRAYQTTRTALSEELGIDPSPDLRALEQRILEHDESLSYRPRPSVGRRTVLAVDVDAEALAAAVASEERVDRLVATDAAIRDAIADGGGRIFAQRLNATFASFGDLDGAVDAVAALMRGAPRIGPGDRRPLVRVAIDVGDVVAGDEGVLAGPVVTRVAGLVAMAHPGQILASRDAHSEAAEGHGRVFKSLGTHPIPRLDRAEGVFQLVADGTPPDFPALRSDRSTAIPGGMRSMPGYELREQVARGAAWSVWRAYQPSVGREVAIKIISPELASTPEFVRRFELEALTVARLEHPHIVPLFDYWRDLSGAYLVSRWIAGGSLASRIAERPLTMAETSRLIGEVGSALEAAHRSGVAHGQVGAESILVGADGAFYLHDFGVGVGASGTSGGDLAAQDVTDLLDTVVGAMGVGDEPQQVVDRLREQALPLVTMADLSAAWRIATGVLGAAEVAFTPTRNPYRGLAAFSFADAEDFFGRDTMIRQILDALTAQRLVAVVGPSGVGKSSVVHAGVMPAVVGGDLPGSDGWLIAQLTPGAHPFEAFVSGLLRIATSSPPHLDEDVVDGDRGMLRAVSRAFVEDTEILIIVDQFEELFTLTVDEDMRQHFLRSLAALVTDPASNARVIVTVRADFFDQPLLHPEFGELLRRATVPVSAPTEDELRDIIERPAAAVSVGFEAGLADRIVADVGEEPGRLPLLEYALTELFDRRSSDMLAFHDYEAIGGVFGALGGRAEETFATLDAPQASAARQIFLRLVTLTDAERVSRRRVRRVDLERLETGPGIGGSVVDAFVENRLLTLDRDPITHGPTVEVAHEAIFSEWSRLAGWIDERRDDLATRRRLVEATQEWEDAGRNPAMLLGGGRLAHLEEWARSTDLSLTPSEAEFLEEGVRRRAAEKAVAHRRRRRVLSGFALAAVVGLVLAALALIQWRSAAEQGELKAAESARAEAEAIRAEDEAQRAVLAGDVARARELSLRAVAQLDIDPERGLLLALEAVDLARSAGGDLPEATAALRQAVAAHRTLERYEGGRFVDVSPDGTLLVTSGVEGLVKYLQPSPVRVMNRTTGEVIELMRDDVIALGAKFSPDGRSVAVSYSQDEGSPVWIWDLETGRHLDLPGGPTLLLRADHMDLDFSPNGALIASVLQDDLRVWSTDTGQVVFSESDTRGQFAGFLSDGDLLVGDWGDLSVRTDNAVRTFDVVSGEETGSFAVPFEPEWLSVSPSGDAVAVADTVQGRVGLFDLVTGESRWEIEADRAAPMAWLDDGESLIVTGDRAPRVLDPRTGELLGSYLGHAGPTYGVTTIPGSDLAVTAGWLDETVHVWDASPGPMAEVRRRELGPGLGRFAQTKVPDRIMLTGRSEADPNLVVDADNFEPIMDFPSNGDVLAFRPLGDGSFFAVTEADGLSNLIDVATGSVIYTAPRGYTIAEASGNGRVVLLVADDSVVDPPEWPATVDLETGALTPLEGTLYVGIPVLSLDGSLLFAPVDDGAVIDTATGTRIFDSTDLTSIRPMPDGVMATIATVDNDLMLVPVDELRETAAFSDIAEWSTKAADASVFPLMHQVNDSGTLIMTSPRGEPVRVWNAQDGSQVAELYPNRTEGAAYGAFDPFNPDYVTVMADRGILLTYTLDVDELVDIARSRLTRSLTDEECVTFLHLPAGCPTG